MLQSSNHHYLRPDYMAATPSTLDNKTSPLALLAQTCSAIGADTANPKLLAANIEKSTKTLKGTSGSTCMDQARDKSSPVSSHSSSVSTGSVEQQQHQQQSVPQQLATNKTHSTFKPYESNINHLRETSDCVSNTATNQHVNTPRGSGGGLGGVTAGGTNGQRCSSNQSASSSQRESPSVASTTNELRHTPTASASSNNNNPSASAMDMHIRFNGNGSPLPARSNSKDSASLQSPNAAFGTSRLEAASEAVLAAAKEAGYVKALHAAQATGTGAYYPAASSYVSAGGIPYPMELMTASTFMSPHHPMFKAAAMNPYLNYARLKSLDQMAMLTPNICRDPYCTGCPSSPHFLNKAAGQACPAGCPQCEATGVGKSNSVGGSNAAAAAAVAAASSYHAQLAALAAASQLPYVCSWIGSDAAYCGKRFGTSDDLFQHLRTHTASVPDSVLSAAAAGGIPPNHPLFQRTYPTPPLSPLSAAARYHPYGKPTMLPPSLAPPGMAGLPPHPSLAQYFAPYSLYGPRMGSSHP